MTTKLPQMTTAKNWVPPAGHNGRTAATRPTPLHTAGRSGDDADSESNAPATGVSFEGVASDAVLILGGDGTVIYSAGLDRLMRSPKPVENCSVDDVLRLKNQGFWDLILERFSSFDFISNEPALLSRFDGGEETIYVSAKAVPEVGGLSHRITCRLNLQPEACAAIDPQSSSPEDRQRLEILRLANVARSHVMLSHELRNPLSVVVWSAQALQNRITQTLLPAEGRDRLLKDLGRIHNAASHMAKIISSVYAAVEKRPTSQPTEVAVEVLAKQILDWYLPFIAATGVDVAVDLKDADKLLRCQSHQVVQVLTNLLMNARDAVLNLAGGRIELATCCRGGFIELSVTDNGNELKLRGRQELPEPVDLKSAPVKVGGLSLGLSICEDLAERNGGHFFRDRQSSQTRFVLLLPVAAPIA